MGRWSSEAVVVDTGGSGGSPPPHLFPVRARTYEMPPSDGLETCLLEHPMDQDPDRSSWPHTSLIGLSADYICRIVKPLFARESDQITSPVQPLQQHYLKLI